MGDVFRWLCVGLMILACCAFLLGFLASVVADFVNDRAEKRLRRQLVHAGRFISWADLEAKFSAGTGTLIIEHLTPKGPVRVWWTEDDVIAAAPLSLSVAAKSPWDAEVSHKQYSKLCATRYVDEEAGSAKATEVPAVVWSSGSCTLAGKYPQGKVVTLLDWWEEPLLFLGEPHLIFARSESRTPPSGAE